MLDKWASEIVISDDTLVKKNAFKTQKYIHREEKQVIQKKDINTATENDFIPLPGIAEKLSTRIVRYREALGGFYDYKQLYEVWGLNEKTIEEIQKYFFISLEKCCKKININNISSDELKKHPYLRGNIGKVMVTYRTVHGKFNSASDLLQIKEIPDSVFAKIMPYIEF
ncbi:MAG: helix-hairpin-helix domain-containing protein [Chitinophagaceae bacterium]|nr:helix-hairpin-helix domain-containing protein [Chitinophagaceae bacterium]